MKMKKALALGLSTAMAAGMLAGCGSSDSSSASSAAAETAAESTEAAAETTASGDEKVLNFGCQMYSDGNIDPLHDTNGAWNLMRYGIGECLFKFDDSMNPQPWLAEDATTEDNITWVVQLKEGIKFSDGCDMTATKVAQSLQTMLDRGPDGSSTPERFLPYETEITADDDANTVTIVLPSANFNLKGNLCYPVAAIVDVDDTEDYMSGTIGTGPYMVENFEDQVGYTMVANENYYEEVPYDKVEIIYMGDASAKAMALQSGQVDLVENITNVSDLQKLEEDENYTVDIASGVRCGFAWMNFNGVLGNDTLRQAILMGIDYQTICESNTIGGLYTAGFSVLPSTLDYGYDNLTNPYEYDPEGAAKLLDDADIVDTDGDGIRELDGENINLTAVSYENRLLNDFMDAQTQYLTDLGIGITPSYGSSDDQWSSLVAGEYDFNQNNWTTVGNGDPTEYLSNWYSKAASNYCGYESEDYDKAYEALMEESDLEKRAELIQEMQQILVDDAAVLVDGYYNSSMISSNKVANAHIHTADYYWITTEITPAE
ncbi:MAG: ABC transporter substrate-binding protein [Lachnospiraceae bacterium]|nr:ABC transporter substrate-binding protein [Lachnospiraceae bacterium]